MPGINQFLFGSFDASIWIILRDLWDELPPFHLALIRCVDSTRDPNEISTYLRRLEIQSTVLGVTSFGGALVTADDLKLANEKRLFNGFDEVWFFESLPSVERLAPGKECGLTCDGGPVDRELVENVAPTLSATGCHLVLGDGTGLGLNCITTDPQLWNTLCSKYQTIM